ncbi:MAG: hypothetical protein ABL998_10840 [Planctomycetota bacterium]
MKHAIEIVGKVLGGMIAAAALASLAAAQHTRPHGGVYNLEGDVILDPARGFSQENGKVRGLTLSVEIAPEELDGRVFTTKPIKRRLCLAGGAPGSLAAVHVARRVLYAGETRPVGGIVLRGTFDRYGLFLAEIPEALDLAGLVAQGAAIEARMASVTIDLGGSEEEAIASWTLGGRLAKPTHGVMPRDGMEARFALPRRTVLSRD